MDIAETVTNQSMSNVTMETHYLPTAAPNTAKLRQDTTARMLLPLCAHNSHLCSPHPIHLTIQKLILCFLQMSLPPHRRVQIYSLWQTIQYWGLDIHAH